MLIDCLKQIGKGINSAERTDMENAFNEHRAKGLSEYDASIAALAGYHKDLFDSVNELRVAAKLQPAEYRPLNAQTATTAQPAEALPKVPSPAEAAQSIPVEKTASLPELSKPANKISAETTIPEVAKPTEGAIPETPEISPQPEQKEVKPRRGGAARAATPLPTGEREDISLSQFVRKRGGIVPAEMFKGELDRLRTKDTGTTGLINRRARQGSIRQTADIMMQLANDSGFRDPETGQPFDHPGNFLLAVERDVAGHKIFSTHREGGLSDAEFARQEEAYYADKESRAKAEEARVNLLSEGRGAELFDKIRDRKATYGEHQEFTKLASEAGIDEGELRDIIAGARAEAEGLEAPRSAGASAARPTEQLGFVQEGLTQQEAARPRSTSQRDTLIAEEKARQETANPERTEALRELEEVHRRGLTVDEYARQGNLFGAKPSPERIKLLRELDGELKQSAEAAQMSLGPGAAAAAEGFRPVKERKFGVRFTEDERIAQDIRDTIGTAKYYEPIPNDVTAEQAKGLVDSRGVAEAMQIVRDESNQVPFHVKVAMGEQILLKLNQSYRNLKNVNPRDADFVLNQANEMAEHLMEYGTRLGQGVQAFAMWARQTPEGILLTYQKAVRKARETQGKLFEEDVKEIVKTVNKEGLSDAERLEELKKLFKTNKTARKVRSEFEKLLEAAKSGKLTDNLFYDIVGDKLGLPKYNKEVAGRITDLALQVDAAPEGLPRDRAIKKLATYLAEQKGFDPSELPLGIFYTHILSGYNTHAVNIVDTAANVWSEINGMAMTNPRAAAKIYSGLLRGLGEGRFDAMLSLTEGRMFRDSKWLEAGGLMEVAKFGKKGGVPIKEGTISGRAAKRIAESKIASPLNLYKYVFRAMSAADAVNARGAQEARANLLAYRMAENEGLKGEAFENRVREILGTDKMSLFEEQAKREGFTGSDAQFRAIELRDMFRKAEFNKDTDEFAGEATYNHKPHGTLGLFAQTLSNLSNQFKPLKAFVPFTQIVANVTNRGLNWTPYGFKRAVLGWGYGNRAEPITGDARAAMLTRATAGTAGLVLLGALQESGLITIHGNGPSDREKRRQMQEAGWRPYTLQVGKNYISYLYTPVGLGLSILGNYADSRRYHELQQKDAITRAAYGVTRVGSTIFSQSFLSGLSRLFDALSDDSAKSVDGIKRSLSGTAQSFFVPNLARDVYRLFDNKSYQSNTMMQDLVRNTPFAALALKPQLNAFGEPVKLQRQRFFDVQTDDPGWKFVIEKGLRVPVPSRTSEVAPGVRITPEQYYDLLKSTGPKVKQWIIANQGRLNKMKEQDAQDELQQAASKIRKLEMTRIRLLRKKVA